MTKFDLQLADEKLMFTYTNSKGVLKTVRIPDVMTINGEKVKFKSLKTKKAKNAYLEAVEAQYQNAGQKAKDRWNGLSHEEKESIIAKSIANQKVIEYTEEQLKILSEKGKARWNALSDEEKEAVRQRGRDAWNNKSDEEKDAIIAQAKEKAKVKTV